jgi:hypothetical protein
VRERSVEVEHDELGVHAGEDRALSLRVAFISADREHSRSAASDAMTHLRTLYKMSVDCDRPWEW